MAASREEVGKEEDEGELRHLCGMNANWANGECATEPLLSWQNHHCAEQPERDEEERRGERPPAAIVPLREERH